MAKKQLLKGSSLLDIGETQLKSEQLGDFILPQLERLKLIK